MVIIIVVRMIMLITIMMLMILIVSLDIMMMVIVREMIHNDVNGVKYVCECKDNVDSVGKHYHCNDAVVI